MALAVRIFIPVVQLYLEISNDSRTILRDELANSRSCIVLASEFVGSLVNVHCLLWKPEERSSYHTLGKDFDNYVTQAEAH